MPGDTKKKAPIITIRQVSVKPMVGKDGEIITDPDKINKEKSSGVMEALLRRLSKEQ